MTTCKKDGGGWVKFIISNSLKIMRKRRVGVKSSCHDFWRSTPHRINLPAGNTDTNAY